MSSTCSFLKRENGPREGTGFLRGLCGSSAHMAHRPARMCGRFARTSTHSPQMRNLWPWRLLGGIRLAVTRGKTPGLTEPGDTDTGTVYRGVHPSCLGRGLQAGEPWAGLSPEHQWSTDGPGQPGPGRAKADIEEKRQHCPRPGPSSARSQG